MKNKKNKFWQLFTIIALIGFAAVACDDGTSSDSETTHGSDPLTGTVSISGTAEVGQTLTAVTTALGGKGTISYQWKRGSANIGENSSDYQVKAADIGSTITVTVTRAGYSGSKTSAPTAVVTSPGSLFDTAALQAKIADAENLKSQAEVNTAAENVAMGAHWVTQAVMTAFDNAINTAKSALTSAANQAALDSAVTALQSAMTTFSDARQTGTKASGFTSAQATNLVNEAKADKEGVHTSVNGNDVSPVEYWVSSSALAALNAAISALESASGQSAIDAAYLALIQARETFTAARKHGTTPDKTALNNAITAADTAKNGVETATSKDQVPQGSSWATAAQFNALNTVITAVTAVKNDNNATKNEVDTAASNMTAATAAFTAAVNGNGPGTGAASSALTGMVSISGTAEVGQTLTADTTALGGTGTISYQWKRGSANIDTATSSTYTVQYPDVSYTITVTVTRAGYSGSKTSAPTAAVPSPSLPALTGTVSISGDAIVGETLTAVTTALGGSGTISYQWKRGSANIGENKNTYVVEDEDVGETITVTVTRTGNSGSKTSEPTAEVEYPSLPELTGTVTITGTAAVGQTLTANTSALGGSGTISYQWKRYYGSDIGTNQNTYVVQNGDANYRICVVVTRSGNSGFIESEPTDQVPYPPITDFTFTPKSNLVIGTPPPMGDYNGTSSYSIIGDFSAPVGGFPYSGYTYSLVAGEGSTDNSLFTVSSDMYPYGNGTLRVGSSALTETRTYSVRVQITDSTSPTPYTFAKAITFTVSYPPAPAASASVSSEVTINGTSPNSEGEGGSNVGYGDGVSISIYLTNAKFKEEIAADTDVSSWFSPTVAGLSYKTESKVWASSNNASLKVTGAPATASNSPITITLPANKIIDNNGNPTLTGGLVVSGAIAYSITQAAEYVCKIGETKYTTLDWAINTLGDSASATITVIKNIELNSAVEIPNRRTVTLVAETDGLTISPAEGYNGALFTVTGSFSLGAYGTSSHTTKLIIDGKKQIGSLIMVQSATSTLNLNKGAEIRNANYTGVYLDRNVGNGEPMFNMNGGVIGGCNTAVLVGRYSRFTMTGGIIYGNDAGSPNANTKSLDSSQSSNSTVTILSNPITAGTYTVQYGSAP